LVTLQDRWNLSEYNTATMRRRTGHGNPRCRSDEARAPLQTPDIIPRNPAYTLSKLHSLFEYERYFGI